MTDQSLPRLHTVWAPPPHRALTQGAVRVTASGATIRAGLADTQFPGIGERLVAGQKLRPDIAVAGALPARRSHAQIAAALLASDLATAMHPGDNVDSNQNIHL